jgi:hypothetical protein
MQGERGGSNPSGHQPVVTKIAMTMMEASVRTITNGLNRGSGAYLWVIRHTRKVSASLL